MTVGLLGPSGPGFASCIEMKIPVNTITAMVTIANILVLVDCMFSFLVRIWNLYYD
jgi:hypothetical protein